MGVFRCVLVRTMSIISFASGIGAIFCLKWCDESILDNLNHNKKEEKNTNLEIVYNHSLFIQNNRNLKLINGLQLI